MNRKSTRLMALMLSVFVAIGFTIPFTQTASAASKTKSFYVVTKVNTTLKNNDGSIEKGYTKYTYDKKGLVKQMYSQGIFTSGEKDVYVRNDSGMVKSTKTYNKSGKLIGTTTNTIKNGKVKTSKHYNVKNGKKTLYSTSTYTYNKKGRVTKETFKTTDGVSNTSTYTYYANGKIKKEVLKTSSGTYTYNYDKKGRVKTAKEVITGDYAFTANSTYKYTTNKKGDITKRVCTMKITGSEGTSTDVETTTYKYTYDKKSGKPSKVVRNYKSVSDNGLSYSSSSTDTYKYKKVKVAKKYWDYVND